MTSVTKLRVATGNEGVRFDSSGSKAMMVSSSAFISVSINNRTVKAHHLDVLSTSPHPGDTLNDFKPGWNWHQQGGRQVWSALMLLPQ